MMDGKTIDVVIQDHFKADKDVLEVAMYALSVLAVNEAITGGILDGAVEMRGIHPKTYKLMRDFDNGMTANPFWLKNYEFIKFQIALNDIKLNTMHHYIKFAEEKDNDMAFKQVRAILLSRCDVLTTIAFLWKGVQFAERFDSNFRIAIQLTPEHEKYFRDKGIN